MIDFKDIMSGNIPLTIYEKGNVIALNYDTGKYESTRANRRYVYPMQDLHMSSGAFEGQVTLYQKFSPVIDGQILIEDAGFLIGGWLTVQIDRTTYNTYTCSLSDYRSPDDRREIFQNGMTGNIYAEIKGTQEVSFAYILSGSIPWSVLWPEG